MESSLNARDRVGIQDFVLLDAHTSESAFLDNLRKRFHENLIYVSPKRFSRKADPAETAAASSSAGQQKPFIRPKMTLWDVTSFCFPLQTYIGTLLVSVNPYKELDIYSKKQMDTYMGVNFFELPPHM